MPDAQHQRWGAQALWQRLHPLLPGLTVEVVAQADSTNTRLLERARVASGQIDGAVTRPGELDALAGGGDAAAVPTPRGRRQADIQPCLLVAESQTRGRGRLGRDWVSSPGASLTFSLALVLAPSDWLGLSLAVGLALAEALDPRPPSAAALAAGGPQRIGLKWPNDLWIVDAPGRGRKLGGILIETLNVGTSRMCVVGVGLNVLPQPVPELAQGYACVQEFDPRAHAPALLARIAEALARALLDFQARGFAPHAAAYARRDVLLGRAVTTSRADIPDGTAEGVDARGALRLRRGGLHHLVSGEVSVRLEPPPGAA
jgi:BirA family biotin operon repressor/biotin-[acetyl-CoA-carboxylase] ligase